MIRKFQEADLDKVAKIWLDTNIETHNFISMQYWKDNFELVKEMFLQAEIYVYENEKTNEIQGFAGLNDDYIAGIFVSKEARSNGIGKQLLDYIKERKTQLRLSVYKKNARAVKFYQREDFKIESTGIDKDTDEEEYTMTCKLEKC